MSNSKLWEIQYFGNVKPDTGVPYTRGHEDSYPFTPLVCTEDEEEDAEYELSVIRKDNSHGHDSWGWGDATDKIILYGEADNCIDFNDPKEVQRAFRVAQSVCDELNKEE